MLVLSVIGIIIGLIIIAQFIKYSNEYSLKTYQYKIFNIATFTLSVIAYIAIFYGRSWYLEAIAQNGDVLNGVLLVAIGILIILGLFFINIKNTSFVYGFIMSIVTGALYLAATPLVIFSLIFAIGFFAQTKPVYNIR